MREEIIGDCRRKKYPRGKRHYAWLGDAVSVRGGRTRALRTYPEPQPCAKCGAHKTERHHADGNTANNTPDNIEFLCRKCHMLTDGRLRKIAKIAAARQTMACRAAAFEKLARASCANGHEWTPDNTRKNKRGARICRTCARNHKARYLAKKKACHAR